MGDEFKLAKADGVAVLTFNRPEKRNPLNEGSLSELYDHLMALRDDGDVRAVVLTGSGNSFCAGADLSHMKGVTDEAERVRLFSSVPARRRQLVRRTMELLVNLELPTVAAVNGYAVGGGWFLALSCDFRLAVEGAEFWMPEIDLGVPGPREPERRLREEVGAARAKEIILTCRHFKAEELYQWGLLNRVVKKSELMPQSMELARYLASRKRAAMTQAKAQLNGFTLD
ncbi:MAG TPA: enoyl-CoA hydratase/isomerase family protein [Candidatus Binataceae bacterium]|jgi:enoyl-CoA hydratase/carnithine racemase|nr:enoyl-CoA hydratase/isomerase family protein [Candidatus Binataceae bacterium]